MRYFESIYFAMWKEKKNEIFKLRNPYLHEFWFIFIATNLKLENFNPGLKWCLIFFISLSLVSLVFLRNSFILSNRSDSALQISPFRSLILRKIRSRLISKNDFSSIYFSSYFCFRSEILFSWKSSNFCFWSQTA